MSEKKTSVKIIMTIYIGDGLSPIEMPKLSAEAEITEWLEEEDYGG